MPESWQLGVAYTLVCISRVEPEVWPSLQVSGLSTKGEWHRMPDLLLCAPALLSVGVSLHTSIEAGQQLIRTC